jgi:hypothetical protein
MPGRPWPLENLPFALLVGTVLAVLLTAGVLTLGLPD